MGKRRNKKVTPKVRKGATKKQRSIAAKKGWKKRRAREKLRERFVDAGELVKLLKSKDPQYDPREWYHWLSKKTEISEREAYAILMGSPGMDWVA